MTPQLFDEPGGGQFIDGAVPGIAHTTCVMPYGRCLPVMLGIADAICVLRASTYIMLICDGCFVVAGSHRSSRASVSNHGLATSHGTSRVSPMLVSHPFGPHSTMVESARWAFRMLWIRTGRYEGYHRLTAISAHGASSTSHIMRGRFVHR
jgi:hypothetical protein